MTDKGHVSYQMLLLLTQKYLKYKGGRPYVKCKTDLGFYR